MEIGHAQNTNIRLHKLEDDVRELKLRQPVEHAPNTPFIGEAVDLSSVSIKETALCNVISSMAAAGSYKLLSSGELGDIAENISLAFDSLNTNNQNAPMTIGVNMDFTQDIKEVIQDEIDKHLRRYGVCGK